MMGYAPKTMQTKPDVLLLSYTLILLAVRFFLKLCYSMQRFMPAKSRVMCERYQLLRHKSL